MGVSESQGAELLLADEACEVVDFSIWITSIDDTTEIVELGTRVGLCCESSLEALLCGADGGGLFDEIQMGENAHDLGEAVCLEDVEKFHRLHFKAKRRINHEEDKIGNLADVDHGVEVVATFNECEPALFSTDDCDGPSDIFECVLGVFPNETSHECCLANALRPHDGNNDGWGFIFVGSVDQWYMKSLLVSFGVSKDLLVSCIWVGRDKSLLASIQSDGRGEWLMF